MVTFFDDCPFNGKRKMADLIFADHKYLLTLERFNISLGFGNYTISEVLKNSNVDENTFLLVVNTLFDYSYTENYPLDTIDILQIVNYLKKTHNYFINYKLPSLRAMLRDVIEGSDDLHKNLLIEFFEKYENEVIRHMQYEESHVFHEIEEMLKMPESRDHNIGLYEDQHHDIDKKLYDLRNIIIKYLPPLKNVNKVNDLLFALYESEEDWNRHALIEERILFPAVKLFESNKNKR